MKFLSLRSFVAVSCVVGSNAFVAPKPQGSSTAAQQQFTKMAALSPDQIDFEALNAQLQHFASSTSFLVADAADAVMDATDAVAEVAEDSPDFWQSYWNIFKAILLGVHDAIDPTLRNAGITQTWGISIFVFTASK